MSEWYDNQKEPTSDWRKRLAEYISDRLLMRRKLIDIINLIIKKYLKIYMLIFFGISND